jgi:hypothetical protein
MVVLTSRQARDQFIRESPHEKVTRFALIDAERRRFRVERWCLLSSHDGWLHLAGPADLSELVEAYTEHLGAESFYELF